MKSNFQKSLTLVLKSEGGFSDDKNDPGNWTGGRIGAGELRGTKFGISAAAHPNLDIPNLTIDQAATQYQANYWNAIKGDSLPLGIDYATFDYGVNSGPSRAVKSLQSVLGVAVDGIVGPVTLAAATKAEPVGVINALCDARLAYLKSLNNWPAFGAGWTNRVAAVRAAAIAMLATAPAQPYPPLVAPTPLPKPSPAPRGIWQAVLAIFNAILALLKRKV